MQNIIYIIISVSAFVLITICVIWLFAILLNRKVKEAKKKLQYVLFHSGIVTWKYMINSKNLCIDFGKSQVSIPLDDYISKYVSKKDYDKANDMKKKIEKMENDVFTFTLELNPLSKKSTEMRYAIINGIAIRNKKGNIIGYNGLHRDITKLINIQKNLEYQKQRAMQSDKLKSAFLANMSHEIRTPLNAIVGFSDLLTSTTDVEERQEYMDIIRTNNELLLKLINDILDLSKIESGDVSMQMEEFDFAEHFNYITSSFKQKLINSNVTFTVINPLNSLIIYHDKNRLSQIITNFVTNAIKYTKEGEIKVGYEYKDDTLNLYVEDTGSGIPKDKINKVFQRFEKLNSFVQGTGLGLSICKAIVDKCNGEIGCKSTLGMGSLFWAKIPCGEIKSS